MSQNLKTIWITRLATSLRSPPWKARHCKEWVWCLPKYIRKRILLTMSLTCRPMREGCRWDSQNCMFKCLKEGTLVWILSWFRIHYLLILKDHKSPCTIRDCQVKVLPSTLMAVAPRTREVRAFLKSSERRRIWRTDLRTINSCRRRLWRVENSD